VNRRRPSDETPNLRTEGEARLIELPQDNTQDTGGEDFLRHLYRGADIAKLPPVRWVLRGRMPMQGLTVLYAPPKGGKSFVAVEVALRAALGEPFWGEHFPTNSRVLYIAAERASEVRDRIEAACTRNGHAWPDNLHLFARDAGPAQVNNDEHHAALCKVVEAVKPTVIIFDTFARMSLGIEENAAKDMGPTVERFLALVRAAGPNCAGLIVHHAGKDNTKGLRGSTALLGAVDAVWKVSPEGQGLRLEVEAINAGETPEPLWFKVTSEELDPLPDDDDRTPRSVGVFTATNFGDIAHGIETDLAAIVTEYGAAEGLTTKAVADLYNEAHPKEKPKVADTIGRRLRTAEKRGLVVQSGDKKTRRWWPAGTDPNTKG